MKGSCEVHVRLCQSLRPTFRESADFPSGSHVFIKAASSVSMGFPGGSDGKESACNEGDLASIPGWEDTLEKGRATHSISLPGKPQGQRILEGYSPWSLKEAGMTERLTLPPSVSAVTWVPMSLPESISAADIQGLMSSSPGCVKGAAEKEPLFHARCWLVPAVPSSLSLSFLPMCSPLPQVRIQKV